NRIFQDSRKNYLSNIFKLNYRGFIFGDDDLREIYNFNDSKNYKKIKNFIENAGNPKRSRWYKDLSDQLLENGTAHYKNQQFSSQSEIDEFFNVYVHSLYSSMLGSGYNVALQKEFPKCFVGKDGKIIKCQHGNHRFVFAKLLGVSSFPLQIIAVHEDWYLRNIGTTFDVEKLKLAFHDIMKQHS
ncbi:MAG: hypothetical protein AAF478_14555, partial [Pseudomonadota bacterium]